MDRNQDNRVKAVSGSANKLCAMVWSGVECGMGGAWWGVHADGLQCCLALQKSCSAALMPGPMLRFLDC